MSKTSPPAVTAKDAVPAGRADDLFLSLTPDRVLQAVEAAQLRCTGLCYPLASFENRVYEVELEGGRRVVGKFYRPRRWRLDEILEEHRFLAELDEVEIPVVPPLEFPGGGTLREIEGISYTLFDRRGGRAPDELDDALSLRLGMLVARLHEVGARRGAGSRRPLDAQHYIRRPLAWLEDHQSLPPHLAPRYRAAAEAIAAIADERMHGVPTHRVHADLHLGNVLLRDGRLTLLDLDDMTRGPAVQDLWLALPGRDDDSLRRRELFVEGYERFRAFDRSTLRLIEPLRGLRLVRYAGWLARRWHDPAFKVGWPHFGTVEYWERECDDLDAQLAVIRKEDSAAGRSSAAGTTAPVDADEGVEELTNADYFWDWEG